jgi:hypothetical protein
VGRVRKPQERAVCRVILLGVIALSSLAIALPSIEASHLAIEHSCRGAI